jgi:hypothetical protein
MFCTSFSTHLTLHPWRWRQKISPKRWYVSAKLLGITSQKTWLVLTTLIAWYELSLLPWYLQCLWYTLGMLIQLCDNTVCHGLVNERPLQPYRILMLSVVILNTWPSQVDNFIPFIPLVVIENGTDIVNGMLKIAAAAVWNMERNMRMAIK